MTEYRKPDSFWAPYLQTLPDTYPTLPYLSHPELLQMRGSPLLEEVIKIKRNIARQYAYFLHEARRLIGQEQTHSVTLPMSIFGEIVS